jgi:hypothetical protein
MNKYAHFTAEEDEIIKKSIASHPNSILEALKAAHLEIKHRAYSCIRQRWYMYIRPFSSKQSPDNKFFSESDDKMIIQFLKNYPANLSYALTLAAKAIGRNPKAVKYRYYRVIRRDPKITVITCGSAKGFTKNTKNVFTNSDGTMPDQNLKGYLYIVREMLDLTPAERKKIIDFFNN